MGVGGCARLPAVAPVNPVAPFLVPGHVGAGAPVLARECLHSPRLIAVGELVDFCDGPRGRAARHQFEEASYWMRLILDNEPDPTY